MERAKVINFAKALGLSGIDATKRAGWVLAKCPLARWRHEKGSDSNPSFGIRYGKRKTRCHCFSCDFSEDLDGLLLHLAVASDGNKVAAEHIMAARVFLENEDKVSLFIGKDGDEDDDTDDIFEWPEWYISGFEVAHSHPYLAGRKGGPVPLPVATKMDFRFDAKRQRLGVPVRDFDGGLMGFHGRRITPGEIPYLAYKYQDHYNRPIWLGEHWIDFSLPVVVAESVFDLARVLEVYPNAMCPLMASLPRSKVIRLSGALKVVLLLDPDKAGQTAVEKIKKYLPDTQFRQPSIPEGRKDPGECTAWEMFYTLKDYVPVHEPTTA